MNTFEVYQKFLAGSGKVKVFGTKKDSKVVSVNKSSLRKVYPFLIASFLSFSACSHPKNEKQENPYKIKETNWLYDDIYKSSVEIYELDKLKNEEPLPQNLVKDIMKAENTPILRDYNYNHLPENQENFWSMVKNGVRISVKDVKGSLKLNEEQIKMYKIMAYKMLSQISRKKGTFDEVDLESHNNLKAFNYFEKVVRYKDEYRKVIAKAEGVHDAQSEIFGRYYKDFYKLHETSIKYPEIEQFAKALYKNNDKDKIFSYKDSAYYNKKSYEVLNEWLKEQKIPNLKGMYYFVPESEDIYANSISCYYRRGSDMGVVLGVDPSGDMGSNIYAPVGEVIVHELMHVMQRKPSSAELPIDNKEESPNTYIDRDFKQNDGYVEELGPTLMSLCIDDKLYKEKKGMALESVANLGKVNVNGKNIKLGELAVWFRKNMEEYKKENNERFSVDKMLVSPKVLGELRSISKGYIPLRQKIDNQNFR